MADQAGTTKDAQKPNKQARSPPMGLKNNAQDWTIKEQILRDPVSQLTFQFEVMPDGDRRLRLFGPSLPHDNRELIFNNAGIMTGAGTHTTTRCKPTWLERLGDPL